MAKKRVIFVCVHNSARSQSLKIAAVFEKIALGGARGGGRAPPKQFFEALNARHTAVLERRVSRFLREGGA